MFIDDLNTALGPSGLMTRGAFHPDPDDGVPAGTGTLVMIGNVGPAMWQAFAGGARHLANPLDSWTAAILGRIAAEIGATAVFPFDGPPYFPFQRWAMRADDVAPSPIGPLIHPIYGMWHAYRGAFLFTDRLAIAAPECTPSPCTICIDRPCLSTCPVGAFSATGYDVPACRAHIATEPGRDCFETGCRARRVCPVGQDYCYGAPQAEFHMRHFLDAAGN